MKFYRYGMFVTVCRLPELTIGTPCPSMIDARTWTRPPPRELRDMIPPGLSQTEIAARLDLRHLLRVLGAA